MVVVSYLVVIPKKELLSSGVLVAGIFFNKVFGESITSRVLPILISLSTLGNVMVVSFAHSRVNQELAQENYLPFSKYFQNLNHSAEIYEFVVNLYIYPGTWINLLLTGGLIYLKFNRDKENWAKEEIIEPEIIVEPSSPKSVQSSVNSHHTQSSAESIQSYTEFDSLISHSDSTRVTPPTHKFSAPWACIFVFLAANLFLALFPFVPPPASEGGAIPYWCFPVVGTGCLLMGAVFYFGRNHVYRALGKPMPSYEEQDVIE
ncbi:hypothetical protein OXX69_000095 [Metschnikowia pulcherrima]